MIRRGLAGGIQRLLALCILLALAPLMLLGAFGIWLTDRASPFFVQDRVGKGGGRFRMYKFRTMRPSADPYMIKPEDSNSVVTPIGRLIRKRAIDELPQLLNVVRGDMALIGPRPEMAFIVDQYDEVEKLRLRTKPGLSGLWQLSRVRDRAIHNHMEYDLFYVFNRSFWLDLWLLWRTALFAVFGTPTKIRLAARRWERDRSWRALAPERAKAIPPSSGLVLTRVWAVAAVVAVSAAVAPAVVMAFAARGDLDEGRRQMLAARDSFKRLDITAAKTSLDAAEESFDRADGRLESWIVAPGRLVPIVRQNIKFGAALAKSGQQLVGAGREATSVLQALPFQDGKLVPPWKDGTLDLAPFVKGRDSAMNVKRHVSEARSQIEEADSLLLLPSVRGAREEMIDVLAEAERESDVAVASSVLIPRMFGESGNRTWLFGAENNSELRGRGGYMGAVGIVSADKGKVQLGEFLTTERLPKLRPFPDRNSVPSEYRGHYSRLGGLQAWQNLGMSPHFPSGAKLVVSQMELVGPVKPSGILALDPVALSYLLEVTGPLSVPGIPEQLTNENVVDWSLNRIYFRYERSNEARKERLGDIAEALWKRLTSGESLDSRKLAEAVGRGLAERRIVIYSADPEEQRLIERLGIGGSVRGGPGDYLMVVAQNIGENKMDYYVKRDVAYRGAVESDGSILSHLEITVRNTAPAGVKLPGYIGGERKRLKLPEGTARIHLSAFVPEQAVLQGVEVDGKATRSVHNYLELGKRMFALDLDIPGGGERRASFIYRVPRVMDGGAYRLALQNQATVHPDNLSIEVRVPASAALGLREGFLGGRALRWEGTFSKDMAMSAEVEVPWSARLFSEVASFLRKPLVGLGTY